MKTEYDAGGRVTRVTKPRGVNTAPSGGSFEDDFVTETAYDLLDRPLSVTEYAVDGSGDVDTAATRVTKSCYDLAGDLRSTTAPKGSSGLSSCPDPAADPYVYTTATHTTTFEYDAAHRLVETTDPDGNATETAYDENGAVTGQTDELGKVTTTGYDDRGDRVSLVQPYDTGRSVTTRWEYDPLGNISKLVSPRANDAAGGTGPFEAYTTGYRYDALGRLVREDLPTDGVDDPVGAYGSLVDDSSPIGFWRLAETSGTSAADSSGNGHTGTIGGSPSLGQPGGPIGGGVSVSPVFDGSNDVVDIPDSAALRPSAVTLEAWVQFGSSGQNKGIVTKEGGTDNGYGFRARGNGEIWFLIGREGSSYNRAVATGAVQTGVDASGWHLRLEHGCDRVVGQRHARGLAYGSGERDHVDGAASDRWLEQRQRALRGRDRGGCGSS